MSKRAEERAMEALPPRYRKSKDGTTKIDSVLPVRKLYIRAYEQAEKDLLPLINRLCEAILMDWENKADVAREMLTKLKEYE